MNNLINKELDEYLSNWLYVYTSIQDKSSARVTYSFDFDLDENDAIIEFDKITGVIQTSPIELLNNNPEFFISKLQDKYNKDKINRKVNLESSEDIQIMEQIAKKILNIAEEKTIRYAEPQNFIREMNFKVSNIDYNLFPYIKFSVEVDGETYEQSNRILAHTNVKEGGYYKNSVYGFYFELENVMSDDLVDKLRKELKLKGVDILNDDKYYSYTQDCSSYICKKVTSKLDENQKLILEKFEKFEKFLSAEREENYLRVYDHNIDDPDKERYACVKKLLHTVLDNKKDKIYINNDKSEYVEYKLDSDKDKENNKVKKARSTGLSM